MNKLDNISHLYKGLILRNRAFASFKSDELITIYNDLRKSNFKEFIQILDPMSGYGGGMSFFASKGISTFNIELNPPAYYWQILINPQNKLKLKNIIEELKNNRKLPRFTQKFSITDELFDKSAIDHLKNLFNYILQISKEKNFSIAILLPFASRFANYQKNDTNFTHFKQGGLCSYIGWENDFWEYLEELKFRITTNEDCKEKHINILSDFLQFKTDIKFSCFVTSPPYPNYRDYSKIFKIENWILDNVLNESKTGFQNMIGSDVIKGKEFHEIQSITANKFLTDLLDKAKKLSKKSKSDIQVYYYPYFALYFYNIQQAYIKLNSLLTENAIGYIVVNNNITRDIQVPVGKSICDIFSILGYQYSIIDETEISHLGNIRRKAKRINSRHVRQIVKVWK